MSNNCAALHEEEVEKLGIVQRVIKPFERGRKQIAMEIRGRAVKEVNVTNSILCLRCVISMSTHCGIAVHTPPPSHSDTTLSNTPLQSDGCSDCHLHKKHNVAWQHLLCDFWMSVSVTAAETGSGIRGSFFWVWLSFALRFHINSPSESLIDYAEQRSRYAQGFVLQCSFLIRTK